MSLEQMVVVVWSGLNGGAVGLRLESARLGGRGPVLSASQMEV